jgi:hypothetical protein
MSSCAIVHSGELLFAERVVEMVSEMGIRSYDSAAAQLEPNFTAKDS